VNFKLFEKSFPAEGLPVNRTLLECYHLVRIVGMYMAYPLLAFADRCTGNLHCFLLHLAGKDSINFLFYTLCVMKKVLETTEYFTEIFKWVDF